jgi:glycine dehydrogenase
MKADMPELPYDPEQFPQELSPHYIPAGDDDIEAMLKELGLHELQDLYRHLPTDVLLDDEPEIPLQLAYQDLQRHLFDISEKNSKSLSFIGDGLPRYEIPPIVDIVSKIRGLSTAYTPYQAERSQGTLATLWIYASALSMLTGFEAINASLYDRSTCLFEALRCALRLVKGADTVIVSRAVYPLDLDVLFSLARHTSMRIITVDIDPTTGLTDYPQLGDALSSTPNVAAVAFPQVNSLGNIEDVDLMTDLCGRHGVKAIAVIDPMHLATGGLKPPVHFGSTRQGCHIIIGEGQHLAIGPNFGGPGLGIFGVRFHDEDRASIRATPGRYVGAAYDAKGRACKTVVLAAREQYIRRERATSNICSNQSFMATLAGAALLARGEKGMQQACRRARQNATEAARRLTRYHGVRLRFPQTPFLNEFILKLSIPTQELIRRARLKGIHIGVDVSGRVATGDHLLLLYLSDFHGAGDIDRLEAFFASQFPKGPPPAEPAPIPARYLRREPANLPTFSTAQLTSYYNRLGRQNISPDYTMYPLGSCTMKYNPRINDWAANLPGFTDVHPEAPSEDVQGSLAILHEIQEAFKGITGLAAVTTQPVAGAQGELVSLKMFQAFHADHGGGAQRDVILLPRSAHGTNPATAAMAGFESKAAKGGNGGIVLIEAGPDGLIDWGQFERAVQDFSHRIAGVMVTNPNTAGIFETRFKEMAARIHSVGGLVYMDGANMNAIAGWVDLDKLGVDAVHNNLHKTWSIPHGGGGPGDAIVAVNARLADYLPGFQVRKRTDGTYETFRPPKTIGTFHRHFGNFAHKVRAYTYLRALGPEGIKRMSAVAVLCARYLYSRLGKTYPSLPAGVAKARRMHEFILTIPEQTFRKIEAVGIHRTQVIPLIGKLFLDFGLHAPTVAFPETYGLMIEPTESYTKSELDHFVDVLEAIYRMLHEAPEILQTVPHFTPIDRVDEVSANRNLTLSEVLGSALPAVSGNRTDPTTLRALPVDEVCKRILQAHADHLS